jgi:hypothetical protein
MLENGEPQLFERVASIVAVIAAILAAVLLSNWVQMLGQTQCTLLLQSDPP